MWQQNVVLRLIGEGLFNICYWMYFPYMALYFSDQFGTKIAGILMMLPPFIQLVGHLLGGTLADQVGRKKMMMIGAVIQALFFAIFATSTFSWLDYVAYVCIGIGGGLYSPASDAMIADTVKEEDRKQVFATFITVKNIGAVIGPIIGATLFFDYRPQLLWTCTIVLTVYTMMMFWKLTETLPERKGMSPSFIKKIATYHLIFTDKLFFYYIFAGVLSIIAIMQLDLFIARYVVHEVPAQWGLNRTTILGLLLGINGFMFVALVIPITRWLKHWRDISVFQLSCLLTGISLCCLSFTTQLPLLILWTITFTIGEIVRAPVMNHFISLYAPEERRGQYMGASNMQFTVGRMIAPFAIWIPNAATTGIILLIVTLCSLYFYTKVFNDLAKQGKMIQKT